MKLRRTIYNSIGLAIAAISGLCLLGNILRLARTNSLPTKHPWEFAFSLVLEIALVALVGGGAMMNLAKGRMQRGATIAMCITYCLTILFMPLGVWGFIELEDGGKHRRRSRDAESLGRETSGTFSGKFLRRAATTSWVCATGGLVLVLICASTHVKPLILLAALIYAFALLLSLILGIVALCGIREHGKRGILIPSLFGISVSGLMILFLGSALVVGFMEAKDEFRKRAEAHQGVAAGQTNTISQSQVN